jgi:hypothetical protein
MVAIHPTAAATIAATSVRLAYLDLRDIGILHE